MTIKEYDDTTWGICFNMQNETMQNSNIRKGLLKALNRGNIEKAVPEHYNITRGIVPKSVEVGSQNYRTKAGEMYLKQDKNARQFVYDGMQELELTRLTDIEILCPDDENFNRLSMKYSRTGTKVQDIILIKILFLKLNLNMLFLSEIIRRHFCLFRAMEILRLIHLENSAQMRAVMYRV